MASDGRLQMNTFVDGILWIFDPENWRGVNGIAVRLVEHVWLTLATVVITCVIAIPIGLWLGHTGKGGTLAINISNVGRAIPVFAVLSILILTPLRFSIWSTIIALVLFAIPPVLTNTYVGMREVDRDVVDAATGMGMNGPQLLRKVELPLAMPLLMNGVRLATVQVVATATIAALVAGPGLGRIIIGGFRRVDLPQVIGGAILVALLALVVEGLMELLQRRIDPLRRAGRGSLRQMPEAVDAVTGS
jgi:osmoprotectant transport system permease protein